MLDNGGKPMTGAKALLFTDVSHSPQTHCSGWGAALARRAAGMPYGEVATASGFIRSKPYPDTVLAELTAAQCGLRWAIAGGHLKAGAKLRLVLDNRPASIILQTLLHGGELVLREFTPPHLDELMDIMALRAAAESLMQQCRETGLRLEAGWMKGHSLAIGSQEWHQQGDAGGGVLNTTAHLLARTALKEGLEDIIRELGLPYPALPPKKRKSGRGKVLAHIARALQKQADSEPQTPL